MMKNKGLFLFVISIIVIGIIYYFQHTYPMQFFFLSSIIICLFYFFVNNNEYQPGIGFKNPKNNFALKQTRFFSALCLLVVFLLSIITIKRYQHPSEDSPYFNNTSYHGIKNKGIAFNENLVLYDDEEHQESGIWESNKGKFSIEYLNNDQNSSRFRMKFENFLTPVFCKEENSTYILNPILSTPVGNDFSISDGTTSLRWSEFENLDPENKTNPEYSFKIVFTTSNPAILREIGKGSLKDFSTELYLEDKAIKRGVLLRQILSEMKPYKTTFFEKIWSKYFGNNSDSSMYNDYIIRWVESKSSQIYLLNQKNIDGSGMQLAFFADASFFAPEKTMLVKSHNKILNINNTNVEFLSQDHSKNKNYFFIGFSNSNKLLSLDQINDNIEKNNLGGNNHLLSFEYPSYYSLESGINKKTRIGNGEIRFLKNNFESGDTLMRTNEGFFFNDNVKSNKNTSIDAYLSYKVGSPGDTLDYQLVNFSSNTPTQSKWYNENGQNEFVLNSEGNMKWLFEIKDFSENGFAFNSLLIYLAIIIVTMLFLVIFFPSMELRRIETPILIVAYALLVFRFLLLWRIATFPPMSDIGITEFNTLQRFDYKLLGINLPIPFTLLACFSIFAILIFIRVPKILQNKKNLSKKIKPSFLNFRNTHPLSFHILLLIFFAIIQKEIKIDLLTRFVSILLPIISYLYFSRIVIVNDYKYKHESIKTKIRPLTYFFEFLSYWIESPLFFLSLFTFSYFLIFDRGFALIFLFFLLLKNVFINYSRKYDKKDESKPIRLLFKPSNFRIYGSLSFLIYLCIVTYKGFFSVLISNVQILIIVISVLCIASAFILTASYKKRLIASSFFGILILFTCLFPGKVSSLVESNIKNTIYRTKIFTENVESIMMKFDYNSSEEKKLIETAQNHWYIENYLNAKPDKNTLITLRPHFNTAVNYSTQTRDVVLPRYVISEFGGFMMLLCIVILAIPMLLFFLNFRITPFLDQTKLSINKGSYVGLSSLILLFTICLFVWLTSTNRVVFFGQDFPFLSLTSKLSVLFPLLLFMVVLRQVPEERKLKLSNSFHKSDFTNLVSRLLIFGVITTIFILSTKTEHRFTKDNDNHFRLEFSDIKKKVFEINKVMDSIQDNNFIKKYKLESIENEDEITNIIDQNAIYEIFNKLKTSGSYSSQIEGDNYYFADIMSKLQNNFRMGTRNNSPIFILFDDINNKYKLEFNNTLHLERPPYDIKSEWKGDVVSDSKSVNADMTALKYVNITQNNPSSVRLIMIPKSYTGDANPIGILYFGNRSNGNNRFTIFRDTDKILEDYDLSKIDIKTGKLLLNDVFINRTSSVDVDRKERIMDLNETSGNNFFAKNFIINGKQRFVYPLGAKFPWIPNWTTELKKVNEENKEVKKNDTLFIDYKLTQEVDKTFKQIKKLALIDGMSFSVIAADGNGRIRLMSDYCKQRKIINPNNTQQVAQERNAEHFFVNSKLESIQWGNKNLIQMELGPGSSMKPIIAAAVTSEVHAEWDKLKIHANSKVKNEPGINYYAGCRIYGSDKKKNWIEVDSKADNNMINYLQVSDNMYHSLLLFIGSYEKSDFGDPASPSLTYKILTSNNKDSLARFPEMDLSTGKYYFNSLNDSPEKWPLYSKNFGEKTNMVFFGSNKSILKDALYKNFNLKTEYDQRGESKSLKSGYNFDPSTNNKVESFSPLAYPDFSFLPLEKMSIKKSLINASDFPTNFKNPVLGSYPYQVTPYKMAEMFGNLGTLNRNYSLKISNSVKMEETSQPWDIDASWSKVEYENFLKQNIFEGMKKVFEVGGTGQRIFNNSSQLNGYYLYGKTGTTGAENGLNYKRLAVIISKNDLNTGISTDNKIFVVYFTIEKAEAYENAAKWKFGANKNWFMDYYKIIINQIMESESFKEYMKLP